MSKDFGASSGSHASHEAPSGLRPSGFDPARAPVRAHDLILRVGADTAEGMAWELRHLADMLEREGLSRWSCSGSPSVGHMLSYRHDPEQTHDEYFRQIDDWLARDSDTHPQGDGAGLQGIAQTNAVQS